MFIYFWERQRQRDRVWAMWGAEKEGHTESEAGSRLWAVSTEPDVGLELTDYEIMTWTEVRRFKRLNPPGTPKQIFMSQCLICLFIFERETDTEQEQGRGRERGRHRIQSRLQALSYQHRAQRGARTHRLRSWPELKSDAQPTEPPRYPGK